MQTIYSLFESKVRRFAKRPCITFDETTLTFAQFKRLTEDLVSALDPHVLGGTLVAALFPNGFSMPLLTLAASKLSFSVVPLPPSIKARHFERVMQTVSVEHLICLTELIPSVSELTKKKPYLQVDLSFGLSLALFKLAPSNSGAMASLMKDYESEQPIVVNFTSGSTGDPKPVCVSEKAKLARILSGTQELFELSNDEIVLVTTPQSHSLGFRQSLLPLVTGMSAVIMDRYSPAVFIDLVSNHDITFSIMVSSQLAQLVDYLSLSDVPKLTSLKRVVSSSEQLPIHVRQKSIERLPCELFEIYGASEVGIVTCKNLRAESEIPGAIGFPIKNVQVTLRNVDDGNDILDPGIVGEICVSSSYCGLGARARGQANPAIFYSADLAYRSETGELIFVGRLKDMIKISGISVYPRDIEEFVHGLGLVTNVCVVGVSPSDGRTETLVMLYTAAELVDRNLIFRALISKLEHYQIPKLIQQVDAIPLTSIGKIDRKAAREVARELLEVSLD